MTSPICSFHNFRMKKRRKKANNMRQKSVFWGLSPKCWSRVFTCALLLQSRQILSLQIKYYLVNGLSLFIWETDKRTNRQTKDSQIEKRSDNRPKQSSKKSNELQDFFCVQYSDNHII